MDLGQLDNDETATLAFTSNEKRVNLKKNNNIKNISLNYLFVIFLIQKKKIDKWIMKFLER